MDGTRYLKTNKQVLFVGGIEIDVYVIILIWLYARK